VRKLFSLAVLALFVLPAWAQDANHKWVKSGKDGGFGGCVDMNSIVRNADGITQYLHALCAGTENEVIGDGMISAVQVNCKENMSGKSLVTKQIFYNKDGVYKWADRKPVNTDSVSLIAQSVKMVCHR
jgi:hypothetical protein